VAELVSWCIFTGIHYITLYDIKGELKKRQNVLEQTVSVSNRALFGSTNSLELKWWKGQKDDDESIKLPSKDYPTKQHVKSGGHPAASVNKSSFFLYTTSYEDGKPQIVDTARRICRAVENKQITAKDVNYQLVESNLRVFPSLSNTPSETSSYIPDPDFILNFDESGSMCGFMPWHTRLSEILQMGSLHDITVSTYIDSLYLYSAVERRFGF